jgi:hypothetical protein
MRMGQPAIARHVGGMTRFLVQWQISFMLPVVVLVSGRVIAARWAWRFAVGDPVPNLAYLTAAYLIAGLTSVCVFTVGQWYVARRWLPRPKLWALLTALGIIAGDVIASHVAVAVIAASGSRHQPIGFILSLPDLVRFNLSSVHGIYAAYLLSTGMIVAAITGALQALALPFRWGQKALWLVASSLSGLAALPIDVAAARLVFRIAPATMPAWFPGRLGIVLVEILWLGSGTFVFGFLTGLALYQLARLHQRAQIETMVHQFD